MHEKNFYFVQNAKLQRQLKVASAQARHAQEQQARAHAAALTALQARLSATTASEVAAVSSPDGAAAVQALPQLHLHHEHTTGPLDSPSHRVRAISEPVSGLDPILIEFELTGVPTSL